MRCCSHAKLCIATECLVWQDLDCYQLFPVLFLSDSAYTLITDDGINVRIRCQKWPTSSWPPDRLVRVRQEANIRLCSARPDKVFKQIANHYAL